MSEPLPAALDYARRGWLVFPCHEPLRRTCSCRHPGCASPAKHPRTPRGAHDASTDPATIRGWWRRWPGANVAIRTGELSGIMVLDVDPAHGGMEALGHLVRSHGQLPTTATVVTGSGGRHHLFSHPGGVVRNSAGRVGPGLDIRGDGGYVIAPPSRHASGGRYIWESEEPLAQAPQWLLTWCREVESPPRASFGLGRCGPTGTAWAAAALNGELRRVRAATEGARNDTLNRAAFALGQLVSAGHLNEDMVRGALLAAGTEIGLTTRETRSTVASGLQAGRRSPRSPSPRSLSTIGPGIDP